MTDRLIWLGAAAIALAWWMALERDPKHNPLAAFDAIYKGQTNGCK